MSIYSTQTDTDFGEVYKRDNNPKMTPKTNFNNINELLDYVLNDTKATSQLYNKEMKTNQEIALNNVRNGKFIIGSISTTGELSFSNTPATHDTPQSARVECARLAKLHPGKAFVFVKFTGAELVPMTRTISI